MNKRQKKQIKHYADVIAEGFALREEIDALHERLRRMYIYMIDLHYITRQAEGRGDSTEIALRDRVFKLRAKQYENMKRQYTDLLWQLDELRAYEVKLLGTTGD